MYDTYQALCDHILRKRESKGKMEKREEEGEVKVRNEIQKRIVNQRKTH